MGAAMSSKVLVVDDEKHIIELTRLYLTREGYEVEGVGDGAQAIAKFGQVKPDLVILDIMLPGVDGLTICKEIRKQSQVPIIMLTARDEVTDKVVGLEVGADDYLTKPFHPHERVARAKALLRRVRTESDQPRLVRAGKLEVDIERHEVRYGSERCRPRACRLGRAWASSRSTSSATRSATGANGCSSGRRSSMSLPCSLDTRDGSFSAASSSNWCGAMTSPATRERSTSTSSRSARSWRRLMSPTPRSRRSGASVIAWSCWQADSPDPAPRVGRRNR